MSETTIQSDTPRASRVMLYAGILAGGLAAYGVGTTVARQWLSPTLSAAVGRFLMLTVSFAGPFLMSGKAFPDAPRSKRILYAFLLGAACAAVGVGSTLPLFLRD